MLKRLIPSLYVQSIYHIDLDALKAQGVKGIITDLDNTLVAWDSPYATPKLAAWLQDVRERGFQVCIVSNNKKTRVEEFARPLQLPAISDAKKPISRAFRRAMQIMGTEPHETVVVGDQIFTDVWGGNRMGIYTILVLPIASKEWAGTKLLRAMERFVLKELRKRGMIPWED
ncbi:YqeG family HAD IIIA-type phosphatase [Effusibacillus pohliae]|uniref:YqeG family HAD IIIA-type phosphatase n=1 Tax=Effusibacillus pohliae TaxID=232270 RepID=UPI000375157F|nr:YqeG family HAD IIIA-type phosphatase [Effusibacillus pohliae]